MPQLEELLKQAVAEKAASARVLNTTLTIDPRYWEVYTRHCEACHRCAILTLRLERMTQQPAAEVP
jgi:hypothetical protein